MRVERTLSPLRGFVDFHAPQPTAHAVGYHLPLLRSLAETGDPISLRTPPHPHNARRASGVSWPRRRLLPSASNVRISGRAPAVVQFRMLEIPHSINDTKMRNATTMRKP